jgi:hypothetical protein
LAFQLLKLNHRTYVQQEPKLQTIANPDPRSFLQITSRAICGSPSDVLIQLKLAGQPVSQRWLVESTGYCTKTIRTALRRLLEFGLVECMGRCAWQLTHKAIQFWRGLLEQAEQIEIAAAPVDCPAALPGAAPAHQTQERSDTTFQDAPDEETRDALALLAQVFCRASPAHQRRAMLSEYTYPELLAFAARHGPLMLGTRFAVDELIEKHNRTSPNRVDSGAYKLLYFIGVVDPMRINLCRMPHCSGAYVRAQIAKALFRCDSSPGMLIHCINSGEDPPNFNPGTGHLKICECDTCRDYAYRCCWFCKSHPCTCPQEEFDDEELLLSTAN